MSSPEHEASYFSLRDVGMESYADYEAPAYLLNVLPGPQASVLDFGCGLGQLLRSLHDRGYRHLVGADLEPQALEQIRHLGIEAQDATDFDAFLAANPKRFDFIVLSHVLEHVPKARVVAMLAGLRSLLRPGGQLMLMVPNAQSATGSYWRYEDFTHHTLFTSGSLRYVLRAAGFSKVQFVDVDCTAGLGPVKATLRRLLLKLYRARVALWNAATGSAFHAPSPAIHSYEIKALASD